jgi:hypothetical protein
MNVEIGAEAALCPEKEYISGIFTAVHKKTREELRCYLFLWSVTGCCITKMIERCQILEQKRFCYCESLHSICNLMKAM